MNKIKVAFENISIAMEDLNPSILLNIPHPSPHVHTHPNQIGTYHWHKEME